jgi:hypothetical protein
VDATARQVLTYAGKVADTFFYSSSGGRTADVTEAFSTKPIPYLVSVSDPYDAISPYHDWGPVTLTAEQLGRELAVAGLEDLVVQPGPSGRARAVVATGALGAAAFDGPSFRRALGLRSTWIAIGELALDRPPAPAVYGRLARITGRARGLPGTVLEQRAPGSIWQPGPSIAPAADGSFVATARPSQATEYRLRSGRSAGQAVELPVAPLIRLSPLADGTGVGGLVRPLVPGVAVQLQGRAQGWSSVAAATPARDGSFTFAVGPGDYRARYAPGRGLLAGLSAAIHLG